MENGMCKNILQEIMQKSNRDIPVYETKDEAITHPPQFRARVYVDGSYYYSRTGFGKRKAAEKDAARVALESMPEFLSQGGYSYTKMCNKDEALRAKDIVVKKMERNDFEGAREVALRAQQLHPELENISDLLTICSIHCAAQSEILGSVKDLYGILQLDKFVDDIVIKKQYWKLAYMLHDQNKLPGAEAAFKFIDEANSVLQDPGKKVIYDGQCGIFLRTGQTKPPPNQPHPKSVHPIKAGAYGESSSQPPAQGAPLKASPYQTTGFVPTLGIATHGGEGESDNIASENLKSVRVKHKARKSKDKGKVKRIKKDA